MPTVLMNFPSGDVCPREIGQQLPRHLHQASTVPLLFHKVGKKNLMPLSCWGDTLSKALSHSARLKRQHHRPKVTVRSWNVGGRKSCTPSS